jgi:hypothetical protein
MATPATSAPSLIVLNETITRPSLVQPIPLTPTSLPPPTTPEKNSGTENIQFQMYDDEYMSPFFFDW